MKKHFHLKLVLIISAVIIFSSCSVYKSNDNIKIFPPESVKVLEDGSVPPGFIEAIKESGVDRSCISCNSQNRYGAFLKSYSEKSASDLLKKLFPFLKNIGDTKKKELDEILEDHMMWAMVRAVLIEGNNNNFGAIVLKGMFWKDSSGKKHPLTVFRTALTPSPSDPTSCFYTLLKHGNVKHVINLYDGDMDVADLVAGEKKTAKMLGASYMLASENGFGQWRSVVRKHPEKGKDRSEAKRSVKKLIKEQILLPGGKPPRGNILIHCGGGMHRTGMIIGILQRVINGTSMEEIAKSYSYHTGYRGKDKIGGFERGNLDFIAEFSKGDIK